MCCSTLYGFLAPYQNLEKKLMIQLKENALTEGRADRRTGGRMDKPYFIRHFWLLLGVQENYKNF